jgi:hypothetical protein
MDASHVGLHSLRCFGFVYRHILAMIQVMEETMCDIQWREALGFYFGVEMCEHVSIMMMKALHSSLKKIKCLPPLNHQNTLQHHSGRSLFTFVKGGKSECF